MQIFQLPDTGVVQDNARAFNFSPSDSAEEVTIIDVQELFNELDSPSSAQA